MKVLCNKVKRRHILYSDIVTNNSIRYVKLKITKCKIKFGKLWIFDSFRENSLTRGIPIRLFPKIIRNSNSQPRYHCRRIHPKEYL